MFGLIRAQNLCKRHRGNTANKHEIKGRGISMESTIVSVRQGIKPTLLKEQSYPYALYKCELARSCKQRKATRLQGP
jgi:hypothetical protein